MATSITLKTGPLTATLSTNNDAKAGEVLRLYAERRGCAPEATNREKLQFIVDQLVDEIAREGKAQFLAEREREQVEASLGVGLE